MKKKYLGLLYSLCLLPLYGQQPGDKTALPDSLLQQTYEALERGFTTFKNDPVQARPYAEAYLKKGIADKDIIRQADAYYFLSLIHSHALAERYTDSIILLTQTLKHETYPARGYVRKALVLERMGRKKEALNALLTAYDHATANNNAVQMLELQYHLGLVKNSLEEYGEALDIFRTYSRIAGERYKAGKSVADTYIRGLFALGDAYNRNGKYDSAILINRKGLELALQEKNSLKPVYFTFSMGITAYLEKRYGSSLDSLRKALAVFKTGADRGNLLMCYLYMGKVYRDQGHADEAVRYFKKTDSMVAKTAYVAPEIRNGYESLIDHYRETKDLTNQLYYINRLLAVDSLLYSDYKYLEKNMNKKYTTRQLNLEKTKLENNIKRLENDLKNWIGSLILLILLTGAFTYYYYRRQRLYRSRFNTLLDGKTPDKKPPPAKTGEATVEELHISEAAFNNIATKLKEFIGEKRFLQHDVSVSNWATAMDSNSKYLSRYINHHEQKTFTAYITDLRIAYVIEALKTNPALRRYAITGLAEEIGFNNAQSFSKAFYKKTGLYPSYFIRQLEKEAFKRKNAPPDTT